MEITPILFWNMVLTLVIAPALWTFRSLMAEVKRIDILLNRTREQFATKEELNTTWSMSWKPCTGWKTS